MTAPTYAWAVEGLDGEVNAGTVGYSRKAAMDAWLSFWDKKYPTGKWRTWYRRGHRLVRVRIQEVTDAE